MDSNNLRSKVLSGLFWQYFQRIGNQLVHFIVSIILARILLPEDFGAVALIGVFITISNIFIDSGFSNALIQRKEIDDLDTSSVFYVNIFVSIVFYLIIYLLSPLVASFYDMQILSPLLRFQALQLIIMAFYCVQNAMLVRSMKFKYNFIVNFIAVILSSIVGVGLALGGFGVWSLVLSQLVSQLACVIGFWICVGWRPKAIFSFARVKILFGYGSRILAGSLLHVIYNNVYNLVIGKRYSAVALGYYNRGQLIPTLVIDNAANTINSVMFPALSSIQDNREQYLRTIRRMFSTVAFIVFYIVSLMLPLSRNIISLLLTDSWLPSVPFMQLVCITVCFTPFILLNSAILTSIGESGKYLKSTMYSKLLSIVLILLGSIGGIYLMIAAGAFAALLSVVITGLWNYKMVGYSFKDIIIDVFPSLIVGLLSGAVTYVITTLIDSNVWCILVGGLMGSLTYFICSLMFKFQQIDFIKQLILKK